MTGDPVPDVPSGGGGTAQRPVVVVGGGPVGLTAALRLADLGVPVRVLERGDGLRREGSKALCMQRETLEVWERLGVGRPVADAGVSWSLGRTYFRDRELFTTRLPHTTEHFPPFVNISQTHVEDVLLTAAQERGVPVAWSADVVGLVQREDGVDLHVRGADGATSRVPASYVVAADGVRSTVRELVGLSFEGHTFTDRFLIADVRADLPFPDERRFWFDPPFNPGRTVLVHPQADGVWRIDWQVPPETDVEADRASGALEARIRQIVGDVDYELVWLTSYRFSQRMVDRMVVGRVFLAGDAAHQMSPFGARGMNSGVADAENLAWKLAAVHAGEAPVSLLDTYQDERHPAAVENLAVTSATMDFMVPGSPARRVLRDAVLRGSSRLAAVRRRVDSGRLAAPHVYVDSPVVAPGCGSVAPDAPCGGVGPDGEQLRRVRDLFGRGLVALRVGGGAHLPPDQEVPGVQVVPVLPAGAAALPGAHVVDREGAVAEVYGPGVHLVRPDGYRVAHDPSPDAPLGPLVDAALARARQSVPA